MRVTFTCSPAISSDIRRVTPTISCVRERDCQSCRRSHPLFHLLICRITRRSADHTGETPPGVSYPCYLSLPRSHSKEKAGHHEALWESNHMMVPTTISTQNAGRTGMVAFCIFPASEVLEPSLAATRIRPDHGPRDRRASGPACHPYRFRAWLDASRQSRRLGGCQKVTAC
jgi:hypothetical protein